jgi:hypothetical protein
MIKLIQVFIAVALFAGTNIAVAGTVMKIQNNGDLTTVVTDGRLARLNISADEYIIVDYKKHTVSVVSPQKRQVMLLNANKMAAGKYATNVRTSIKRLGAGIKVAGYPTQKYAYSANGKSCGVIYGSKDVYQQKGIKQLFEAIKTMMDKQRAVLGGFASMVDDCTLADMNVSDHVKTVGVPMRTDRNGRIETEIKSIKHGVALPANTFVIPASYRTVSMQGQLNAASKGMKNVSRNNTQNQQHQMQEMMRKMQQSGQMTPEMMEQMRRSQEARKRY